MTPFEGGIPRRPHNNVCHVDNREFNNVNSIQVIILDGAIRFSLEGVISIGTRQFANCVPWGIPYK